MIKIGVMYLVVMNIIGFFAMGMDKWKAKRGRWRIQEKSLFILSLIGGSIGTLAGMYVFRHKTKHWYFKFGMPAILVIQGVIVVYYCFIR